MSIDRYTKCVLTLIAVCLIWMSLGGPSLLPTAHAQSGLPTDDVVLGGWRDANGVVWRFPTMLTEPTGTFVDRQTREAWENAHRLGWRLPVASQ